MDINDRHDDNGTDDIHRRAYRIWEDEGRPDGRAEEHWKKAEEEARMPAAAPVIEALDEQQKEAVGPAGKTPEAEPVGGSAKQKAAEQKSSEEEPAGPVKRLLRKRRA